MDEKQDSDYQLHQRSVSSEVSSLDTPASEYRPQQLVKTPHSTDDDDDDNDSDGKSRDGYFPTIDEIPRRTMSNMSSRSRWSRRDIYGDLGEEEVELARQQTRDTVKSRMGDKYDDEVLTMFGGANDGATGEEFAELDPELVTWDGPDDPENPRNWSARKKWTTTVIVSLYATVSPISSSILSPAVQKMAADVHMTDTVLQSFSVSIFILAWAICPLFLAPISEMYGRRPVLNYSIVLLLIFNVACGLAKTPAQILVFRFLAGCAGSPPPSVGPASLSDMFSDKERNTPMALWSFGPLMGPVVAPIIAGFVAQNMDWQWVFWILSIITGVCALAGWLFFPESYGPTILAKRAKKLRKTTGNPSLHTIFELKSEPFFQRLFTAVTRPLTIIVTQPIVFGLGLFMAVVYGLMYLLLVTFPQLFQDTYGFTLGITGLMYCGLGVGFMLGLLIWTPCMQKCYMWLSSRDPNGYQPEYRIVLVPLAAVLLGAGLIIYGQTAEHHTHWIWPCVGTGFFAFGLVCVFSSIQNYLVDAAVENWAASTVAAASVFRSSFGGTFPLFGPIMYDKLGYGWANTICGIAAFVLGIPFPIVVYCYGHRIRAWTTRRLLAREAKKRANTQIA